MSIPSLDKLAMGRFAMLYDYEYSALFEALRRDMRSEKRLSIYNPKGKDYHLANCRASLRILEALNPKRCNALNQTYVLDGNLLKIEHEIQQAFPVSNKLNVSEGDQSYCPACSSRATLNDATGCKLGREIQK